MLVKKNAIETAYVNLFSLMDYKIGIPIFQRFYAWKEDQAKQLLEDIKKACNSKDELYLLDFIYYKEDGKIMLADGQQRLVTINLLIKAINDCIDEQELKIKKLKLFNISYDIQANNEKYKNSFENYVAAPFKKMYIFLHDFIQENVGDLDKIIKVLKNKVFIYLKKCSNADDAFQIFQQINTGGKPLTKDEIIKTALDQYSQIYDVKIDTSKIKTIRQDLISYYKYIKDDYNANFDNIAIITFLKKYVTSDKDSFEEFKKAVDKLALFSANPIAHIIKYINRPSLFDVINVMAMKQININNNKKYTNDVLIPLCLASITLSLNGGNPVLIKYMTNDLIDMIKEDKNTDAMSGYIAKYINENASSFKLSLNNFTEMLKNDDTGLKNIKKALLILDVIHKNHSGTLNVDTINLEHIYPQNPTTEWATKGWPTSSEEKKKVINNIGNYLLLSEPVNKKIQNIYITDKVSEYEKIIPKDLILQTKINTVDFKLFEENRLKYINERAESIAKLIKKELPFGEVLILND